MTDPLVTIIEETFKDARKGGLSIKDAATIVAEGLRAYLEKEAADESEINDSLIQVQSIYGMKSQTPLVDFRYGFEHFTLTVEKAREHAVGILECCMGAEMDASVFRWLTLGDMGLHPHVAARAMEELRRFRGEPDREDWRTKEQKTSDG